MRISIIVALVLWSFSVEAQSLIDKKATRETKALYANLQKLSGKGVLFGHQDDDAYGVGWTATDGRSDVKEITGSYPAVHGWDIGRIEIGHKQNLDSVDFDDMVRWIQGAYKRGGITTISWHINNPVTKGDSWDKTPAVHEILPGRKLHSYYTAQLDVVAGFLNRLKSGSTCIPVIFRPWHEHNGEWFWWGKGNASEADYVALWKFTVEYLRDTKKLHHLIYAFSPDASRLDETDPKNSYLYGYPGDEYVDLLGVDDYRDVGIKWNTRSPERQRSDLLKVLQVVTDHAQAKRKVAALTETGLESVTNPNWFTDVILKPLKETPSVKIAYVLVWRNDNQKHHYAPYKGHSSAEGFMDFYKDPYTLFESDLQNLYQTNKPVLK
jgi:mannan endo-1,4-beta-mannosidase